VIDQSLPVGWEAESWVVARLQECGAPQTVRKKITTIPIEAFVILAGRIGQYKREPITQQQLDKMRCAGLRHIEERGIRHHAAELLRSEAESWRNVPGLEERVRQWDAAIAVLTAPRNVFDDPKDWVKVSDQGSTMRPWTYMGTEIAGILVRIFRAYGLRPSVMPTSTITQFTRTVLEFIAEDDDAPNRRRFEVPGDKYLAAKLRETLRPLLKG
jgi:hypothetical protein